MDHVKFVNCQIKMKFDRLLSKLTLNMAYFCFHLLVARHRAFGCCNVARDGQMTHGKIWSSRMFCNDKLINQMKALNCNQNLLLFL